MALIGGTTQAQGSTEEQVSAEILDGIARTGNRELTCVLALHLSGLHRIAYLSANHLRQ